MTESPTMRAALATAVAFALAAPALPQAQQLPNQDEIEACEFIPDCGEPLDPFIDNRDGYLVNLEEGPVHPLELDGNELWAINLPDSRVTVFNTGTFTLTHEIAVALGPVSIRHRPGTNEMWIACQSSNTVVIVDTFRKRIVDAITVNHEPTDTHFTPDGSRAFVSLSASNQVAEIDSAARTVTSVREFATRFPDPVNSDLEGVEEPTTMVLDGNDLFVLSKESGNGTMGSTFGIGTVNMINGWDLYDPVNSVPPPPDRDVVHFDVSGNAEGTTALWRMGSMAFDLARDNLGEIWVSNMDYNNELLGEFQFPKAGIARHRVTHAVPVPGGAAPTTLPASIDLNADALASLVAQGYRCAMPNEMLFSPDFSTLYVACYETHNVAVVDVAAGQVVAELRSLRVSGSGQAFQFGARGLAADWAKNLMYVYSRGDGTVQRFKIPATSGSVASPQRSRKAGFDITTATVRQGRFHSINALRSQLGVQSCNTCHIDGHLDRLAWNLSDFTGLLEIPGEEEPRRPKGTKVTMSLRGIEETPPFHWRGDRSDLDAFNPAFQGLLGGTELDTEELQDFVNYIFSLSYPANPGQKMNREYTPTALAGFRPFQCKPSHRIRDAFPSSGNGSVFITCGECHAMAGASGTLNQVVNDASGPLPDDATQLRGMFDKESDIIDYTGIFPNPRDMLPATGWGMANTGVSDNVVGFVNPSFFPLLCDQERANIVTFLDEFDSGIAPAAAFAWSLDGGSAPQPNHPFDTLLEQQAIDGHIDLIARGWMVVGPATRPIGLLYNPQTGLFDADTVQVGSIPYSTLVQRATVGRGSFLIMGTPVGSGHRLALDQDMDFALDGDELPLEPTATSSTGNPDSDRDGFPDGYELRLGSDPGNNASVPTDVVDPVIGKERIAWRNSNVVKVRWSTDEETTSRIEVYPAGGGALVAAKDEGQLKRDHVLVARGLVTGTAYDVVIVATDASGRTSQKTLSTTTQPFLHESVHLASTTLTVGTAGLGQPVPLDAEFQVVDGLGAPVVGAAVTFRQVEWIPGFSGTTMIDGCVTTAISDANGFARVSFTSLIPAGGNARVEIHGRANAAPAGCPNLGINDPQGRFYFTPLDGQFNHWDQEDLP